jgi:hypothetical protein
VSIEFTSNVTPNYTDIDGDVITLVSNYISVTIPAPSPFGNLSSTQTNVEQLLYSFGDASFSGNARSGTFSASGSYAQYPEPDLSQAVQFSFANASSLGGPLTGSGTASATFFVPGDPGADDNYLINFELTGGRITENSATPETAAWALMALGFGVMGGLMRRQRSILQLAS